MFNVDIYIIYIYIYEERKEDKMIFSNEFIVDYTTFLMHLHAAKETSAFCDQRVKRKRKYQAIERKI